MSNSVVMKRIHWQIRPAVDERANSNGVAIRSNTAWRELASEALFERDALKNELRDCRKALSDEVARLDNELKEAREALAEWHTKALTYHTQRDEHAKRADDNADKLNLLTRELGGLTLSMLPPGAYGGALASLYCDIMRGR